MADDLSLRHMLRQYLGLAYPELAQALAQEPDLRAPELVAELIRFAETWRWRGHVKITHRYTDGTVEVEEFPNLITNAGRTLVRDFLRGAATDGTISWCALGNSATAPADGDTALGAEQFRKATTTQVVVGTGGLTTTTYIAPGEANSFTIQEIGWFAGPSASATPGSGVLVAHVLYSHAKVSLESLEIDRTDTFS